MADNLTTATIDVRANTRGLERDILKALQTVELSQINTKKSSQALGRITGQVSEFNKSLEASNARVVAFGASAGAIFAVEKALSSLISSTIDVQKQLTDINVLLNLSSSSLEKFGNSLFDIARNTAQSFSEVAGAATELSRQGLGVEETLKRTNAALILTRLSGLDAKSSVEALTATLNSFSGSALDAVEVVNKLANVDAAFAVSSADLANAISRVGSTAVDAGVSLDELIALVTSAQQTTARGGAVIGNSFKTIFSRLQRGKVQDLLGSLGVDTSEGQSAISLLQQLASTYDTLGASQKSYVAEQVGGVFQINILKAALSDLGKEYSIYGRALDTSLSSTDEAIRRNALLNKTVSALSSQTVASLEQAANKIGSIVFEPNAKGFLSGFNNLLESFNNIDAESAGGKLMTGFFKGIGDFIGGPGAVLATAVLVKLFARLTQFAAGSAKELLGTNKAAQQQQAIEQSILSILQKNSQFTNEILLGKMTTVQAEKQMLDYLTAQSNILRDQERLSKVIGANLAMKGVSIGASGIPMTAPAKKTKVAASGYIPNFATDMAVGQAMENAGARQHGYKAGKAKKTTIHDGNGKSFKSFVNNKEDVKTFTNAAGKKATIVRPPNGFGENTQYAANGFIPNFAEKRIASVFKSGSSLRGLYDTGPVFDMYDDSAILKYQSLPKKYEEYRQEGRSIFEEARRVYNNSGQNINEANKYLMKRIPGGFGKKLNKDYFDKPFSENAINPIVGALGERDFFYNNPDFSKLEDYVGPDFKKGDIFAEVKILQKKISEKKLLEKALRGVAYSSAKKTFKNNDRDVVSPNLIFASAIKESMSSGFVPNFASMGSKFKAMYGGGTTMRATDKEKTAKKKNLDVKKLDLSDRYTMVHGGNQGLSSADVSLEAGNKLFDAKIATAGLNTAGTNLQRYGIKGVVGDALVSATNNIIKTFGGTEQITDASSLDNAGSVGSAAGTVFETALRKAFNAPAVSQTQRIDFPSPTPELKKFFHNAPGQYEAKISRTPDNLKSALKKWVDVNGLASSSFSGFVPNFAKTSGISYSYKDKDEFGFSEIQAIMSGKKVGSLSYAEDKKGLVDVGDFSVNKGERGKGIGTGLYKEAIKRNAGKKMKGQLLPQMNRLLQKIKNGEPVSAETLYPQIKRADLAKSSVFEVYGHKGMQIEKMTRDQFSSFVNAKINELKKDPKKLQSFFGNVEADEYGGLGVDLQTQHASGFVPNFLDIKKDGSLPFGVRGRANFSKPGSKPSIQLGAGATPDTLFHEASHLAYSKATMSKANSNEGIGRFISDPKKYAGVSSIMASSIFKNVNQNELFKSLGLNPVQLDFDGKNPGATYSGAKAIDEITTRIQEKIFKNKGDLASLSANENAFIKNIEGLGIISNKRMSNVSRRSAEGSKFRSLIEGRFSSAMGGAADGFIPNFANTGLVGKAKAFGGAAMKAGLVDVLIEQLMGNAFDGIINVNEMAMMAKGMRDLAGPALAEFQQRAREFLKNKKVKFDQKINPSDLTKTFGKNFSLPRPVPPPGFYGSGSASFASGGFIPNFSNALNNAIAREQSSGLSKSQIYVDSHSSLKNKNNPMGLMVANRRDEPSGGIQGIKRAKKEGRNPKTYGGGMSSGFVPNFAANDPGVLEGMIGKAIGGDGSEVESGRKAVEKSLKKFPELGSEFERVAKQFEGLNSDVDDWIKKIRELNSSASKSQAPSQGGEANINASQLSGREIVFSRAGTPDKEKAAAKTRDRRAEAEYKAQRAAEGEGSYQTFAMSGPTPSDASAKKSRKQRSLDYLRGGGSILGGKAKDSMLGKGMGYLKQNSMGIGFGLQAAAGMAGEYAGNDDTQTGRGIKAGAGAFGDIASFAGTGAMIAGPYGALAGGLVGAAKGAVDMHKALTTKVPDLEKALQASSDAANRFGESGQKLLMLNEQYGDALMSGNPAQAADIMIKTQQAYAEELSKLTEVQRSSMISAIAQGKGQEEYAKILGEMQNSVKAQETATQLTKFSESGGIFSGPDKKLLAGMDKGLALDFTKGMDTASITAALEKSAASLSDMNRGTENQALDLMKNLASSDSLTGDQKENLNKIIDAFATAAQGTDLSEVSEAFIKSIRGRPKSDADVKKAQQAAKAEIEARAAKAKKEIEIREKTNAMLIKLQSDTEAVYQRYNNSMEDFISSIQTASEMMGAAGQFREEYLVQSGANKNITDPIKEKNIVNKSNADLKVAVYKSQLDTSKGFNEGLKGLLSGLETDSAKLGAGQSATDQSNQLLDIKSRLEQALLPVQEMITGGNYEGAKSKTREAFGQLKPEERTAIGEDKIAGAVKQLESGIDQGARNQDLLVKNSQKDLAIQAQQLIFQKATAKLAQAQNFGGTANQILGDTEDSPFNKAIEAVTSAKIMGYNQKGLQPGSVSAVEGGDRNSFGVDGKKPSIGTAEQIVNFYKAAGEIGGESVMSTESKDFAVLTQAIREQTRKKLDELRGAGQGVVDPAVFTRLETILATLGGGDQAAQLKLMKELGFANISGKKITDTAMKGYSGGAFAGLNPELKAGFEATSDEGASATFLLLADQKNQTASILQGQTAQTDSLNQGLEAVVKAGIDQNGILAEQPSAIAQAIGAILEKGRAEQKVNQSGQKIGDLMDQQEGIGRSISANEELMAEARTKYDEIVKSSGFSEKDLKDEEKLKKAQSFFQGRGRKEYIAEESKKTGRTLSQSDYQNKYGKAGSLEERREKYVAQQYDEQAKPNQDFINAVEVFKTAQEQSKIIKEKTTENEVLDKRKSELKAKEMTERGAQVGIINNELNPATKLAEIAQSKILNPRADGGQAYLDKNEAARQEAAKKKALMENLAMQDGGDLATDQQKKNRARSQGKELTFNKFTGKMDTFENAAMLEFGGANNKSFDKLISQQALPSFENFASVYEKLGGEGKGQEFYQQKKAELLGAEKTVTKPTSPTATTPESVTQGTAAAMDLEKRKKSEIDSLMQKYTKYGQDGKMTFNPRNGFESQAEQEAFNTELAKLKKDQRGYTLENVGAASPNAQGATTKTQEPAAAQKTKQEEQKKPEAEKAQDPSQLISNILTTVNQIAAELQKQVNPAATTGGQVGAGGAVNVSTPVNLSINSTAGENKTEVTNVADKIKTDLTAFLSSAEFIERVTTIAKTAAGNPPPPKQTA
jgi:hypothetical protein